MGKLTKEETSKISVRNWLRPRKLGLAAHLNLNRPILPRQITLGPSLEPHPRVFLSVESRTHLDSGSGDVAAEDVLRFDGCVFGGGAFVELADVCQTERADEGTERRC